MRPPDRPNVKYIAVNTSDPLDTDDPVKKTKRRRKSGWFFLGSQDLLFTIVVWCIFSFLWTLISPLPSSLYMTFYPSPGLAAVPNILKPLVHEYIERSVSEQIEPHKADGIERETLSSMVKHGIRFRIVNNELFITQRLNRDALPDRLLELVEGLISFLSRNTIPNVEFVVILDSSMACKDDKPYFAVARFACSRFLIPDFDLLSPDWGVTYRDLLISSGPWDRRLGRKLYHVGQPDGGMQEKVRQRVDDDSLAYVDFTDPTQFCKYKYVLHLEKGSGYNPYLKYALLCGSTVFWGNSGHYHHKGVWKEYYSMYLEDGHHVWGVHEKTPLSCYKYALKYDASRKPAFSSELADRSQRFASHILSPVAIDAYLLHLFSEYSKLLKFNIEDADIFVPAKELLKLKKEQDTIMQTS